MIIILKILQNSCNYSIQIYSIKNIVYRDGFKIYGMWDIDGAKPIVDECGGHFGYVTDENGVLLFHLISFLCLNLHFFIKTFISHYFF